MVILAAIAFGVAVGFVIGIFFGAGLWFVASNGTSQTVVASLDRMGEGLSSHMEKQDERISDLEVDVYSKSKSLDDDPDFRSCD